MKTTTAASVALRRMAAAAALLAALAGGVTAGLTDAPAPTASGIVFVSPKEGAYVSSPRLTVRVAAPDAVLSLLVNGVSGARDRDGVFVVSPLSLAEGPATLTATGVDRAGRTSKASISVTVDRTPPALRVAGAGAPLVSGALLAPGSRLGFEADDRSPVELHATLNGAPFASGGALESPGSYTLRVEAADRAGNVTRRSFTLRVAGGGPAIANVRPASGSVVSGSTVTVSGESPFATEASVGDAPAALYGGKFAAQVPIADGPNRIAITVRDSGGHASYETVEVVRDDAPPRVAVTSPAAGLLTSASTVRVGGVASDPHLASVSVNGVPAALSAGGRFEASVSLADGANRLRVVAEDAAGNRAESFVDVVRDSFPPELSVAWPGSGTVTSAAAMDVSGDASDANLARVLVNGNPATLSGSRWTARGVALVAGANTIRVEAMDRAGNASRATVSLTRDAAALPVAVSIPAVLASAKEDLVVSVAPEAGATPPDGLRVTVNDSAAQPADAPGRFRVRGLALREGSTSVTVRVADAHGRAAVAVGRVTVGGAAPAIVSSEPRDGARDVPATAVARVFFSRSLDPASVTASTVRLVGSGGAPASASLSVDGRVVAILPAAPLPARSAWKIEVGEGVRDAAGNRIGAPRTIAFSTSGPPAAPELDASPSGVCASPLALTGRTEPGYRVQVTGGATPAAAVADAEGRFSVAVPLNLEQMNVLSASASLAGAPASPPAVRVVRSDCTPPRVERVDLDSRTGALEIVFSEPVTAGSLAAPGAVVLTRPPSEVLPTPPLRLDATGRIARSDPSPALAGGAVVSVSPRVTDAAGNRMRVSHVVSTLATAVGQGGLSGQVFDDRIGRPLPGAAVTVVAVDGVAPTPPAPTTTSAPDGSFGFVVPAGSVAVRTGLAGFVASTRIASVAANDSVGVFDVRLTPETIVTAPASGSTTATDRELTLTIPAGVVAAGSTVRAASLSPQGLPLLLPLGWAPAAAASLELGAATPDPVASTTLSAAATAVFTNRFAYPAGTAMVLARYDAATRRWLGAGSATLSANAATITASIAQTGVYAVLVADPAPYAPPAAVVGSPLGGVTAPGTDPSLSATVTSTPTDVLPTQTADIVATLTLTAPVPSGFPVEVLVSETLTLLNTQQIQVPSFLEDLIVLRDGTGKFIVPFRVRPSSTAAQVALSVGYENLGVKRYGFDLPRGNLIGSAGGTVTGPSGFSLVVPSGALTATVPVTMTPLAQAADVPVPIPTGYTFLAGAQLAFGGQTLTAPASVRWASATDPTGNGLVWVEISTVNGSLRARFVGPGRYDSVNHWVETTPANVHNLFVPGVLDGNVYVLLKSTAPLAYVKGRVLDVGGTTPVASALVTEDGTSIVAVTDGLGQYSLPVPAAGATVRSVRVDTGNPGSAAVASQTAGATASKDIVLAVAAPYVLSVAPATGSLLPLDLPVVFTLSEPLNPATVASDSVTAASGASPIAGTARLSASGTQITFTPTLPWPGKSTVTLTLSSTVTDLQGYRLVDAVSKAVSNYVATWTTVDPTPPTDVNPLLISMTAPSGTPPTVRITGGPGAACGSCTVIAVNDTTTATATTIAATNGSFSLTLPATVTDRVYVIIRRSSGVEIRVDPGPYTEDGGRTAYLSTHAADYITRDGIRVTVDDGSFSDATMLKVQPILQADLPAPMPTLSTFIAAIHFDPGSAVSSRPIDLAVAAPPGITGGQFLVARAVQVGGETKWMVVDVARYDSGSITTRPPAGQTTFGKRTEGEIGLLSTSGFMNCPGASGTTGKSILDRVTRSSDLMILGLQQQIAFVATTIPIPWPSLGVTLTFASQYFYLLDFLPYVWVTGEAKQQCYFVLPVPTGIPFGVLGRDVFTGLTVFQGNFSAATDPTNITQLPPTGLATIVPAPRLMAASPFTAASFVPVTTVSPAERTLLPKITYTFASGALTIKGAAGAVEAGADLSVVNNVRAGTGTGTAAADGSFSLALGGLVAGDDVTFLAGVQSLAPNAAIHVTFSQPIDQASMQTATFNGGAISYDVTPDSGTRGWTLTPRSSFPQGTPITFAIPATKIPKALSVRLTSPATSLLGPRAVKDVNALYLKGGLLLEVTGNGGNVGDTGPAAKLNLYDASNPAALVLCSPSVPLNDFARGVTMDGHDRVLVALGGGGTNGRVQVFRLSPPTGTGACAGRQLKPDGTAATDTDRSFTETTITTGGGNLGVLPEGYPRRLEIVNRQSRTPYVLDRDTTLPQFVTAITKTDVAPADGYQDANAALTITGQIPGSGVSPSPLNQPATVVNLTTGAAWTSYADASGNFTINAKASSGDRLEFRINLAEVAIVGTLAFGLQGVDVNKTVHLYGQDCIPGGAPNDLCPAKDRLLFSFGSISDLSPTLCLAYDGSGACLNAINRLDQLVDMALLPDPVAAAPGALPAPADPASPTVYALVNRFGLATFALAGTGETTRLAQLGSGVPVGTFDTPPIQPNFFTMSVIRGFPVKASGHRQFCTDARWKLATGDEYLPTLAFIASSEGVFVVDVTKASVGGSSPYPEPTVIGLFRMATGSAVTLSVDISRGYVYVGSDGSPGKVSVFDMTDPCTLGLTGRVAPANDPRFLTSVSMSGYNPNTAFMVDADTGLLFGSADSTTGGNGQAFALSLFGPPLRFVADTDRDGQWEQVGSGVPLGVDNPKKPAAPYAPDVVRVLAGIFGIAGKEIVAEVTSTSAEGIVLSDLPSNFPRTKSYLVLTRQSDDPADAGYNRYLSPPIVLVADPRAQHAYVRVPSEDDASNAEACRNCKTDAGYAAELGVWAPATDGVTRATPARKAIEQWAGEKLVVRLAEDAAAETTLKGLAPYLTSLDLKRVVSAIPVTRGDLTPALQQTPAQNASLLTTEAGVAVDTHSGSAQTAWTDLSIQGRGGLDVVLTRYYVSDVLHYGPFGRNLDSPLFARLRALPTGDVDFYPGDGSRRTFRYVPGSSGSPGYFQGPPGVFLDLYRKPDLTFTLIYPDKTELLFDANGRLTQLADRNTTAADGSDGNQLNFSYDGGGRLVLVTDATKREVRFEYNLDTAAVGSRGRISKVSDFDGRVVTYTYDGSGRLTDTDGPDPASASSRKPHTKLAWTAAPASPLQASLYRGGEMLNDTDGESRKVFDVAYSASTPAAADNVKVGGGTGTWQLAYSGSSTTVTDPNANATTYAHTSDGQPSAVTRPGGATTAFSYDSELRLTLATKPLGDSVSYSYPAPGGRSKVALGNVLSAAENPKPGSAEAGAGIALTTTVTYHPATNLPLTVRAPDGSTTTIDRDAKGNPTAVTLPDGSTRQFGFDTRGRLSSSTDGLGVRETYAYFDNSAGPKEGYLQSRTTNGIATTNYQVDNRGNVTSVADPLGHSATYTINAIDQVEAEARGSSSSKSTFNAAGQVITRDVLTGTDASSNPIYAHVAYNVDALGRLNTRTETATVGSAIASYTYDNAGNVKTIARTDSPTTTFNYDTRNRVTTVTTGSATTTHAYDDDDTRTSVKNARNFTTTYLLDGFGRNIGAIDPTNVKTREFLDAAGRSIESRTTLVSGPNETLYRWSTRQFDPAGRVTREIRKLFATPIAVAADGSIPTTGVSDVVTDTTYDANGNVLTVKDPLLRVARNDYDTRGRLMKVTDPLGNSVAYTYDDANNKTTETVTEIPPVGSPQVFLTKYFYDAQNGLTKVTDPLNQDTLYQYDPRGNRTQTTDVELHISTAQYDLLGRKTQETDANAGTTQYAYDLSGHLTSITDAKNNQTTFTYDGDGRLQTEKRADLKTWTYGYDTAGNRTTVTDPNGTVTTTAYDPDDRATGRTITRGAGVLGPTGVTFGLDAIGRITSSSTAGDTAAAVEAFTYDSLDRVLTEQQQVAGGTNRTVTNGYDAASNLTALTYPSGLALTYDIDALNRIAAVRQAGTAIVSYRDVGARPFDRTLANGIVQTWGYDTGRRLNDVLSKKGVTTVSDIAYTLSPLGNKTTISRPDLAKKATYTFNPNSWITQEALNLPIAGGTPERQTNYTVDKVLNYTQIQESVNGTVTATKTQTTNNRNQYPTFNALALTYDPNGNLTGGAGIGGTALAYDFENRLKKATLSTGTVVENIYDAQGRKVREATTVSGVTKNVDYVLHGDQVIEQYPGTNPSARYVHGRGIDETVRAELDVDANGTLETTVYPLQDELGNVERLTDGAGANLERYDYQGYGKPRIFDPAGGSRANSSFGWRWLFQGREYQSTLLAYDFRARELWPDLGRFGQEDPARSSPALAIQQALRGGVSRYRDPAGLYEVDFHYYVVYYLSALAGLGYSAAQEIGFASQYVDNCDCSRPVDLAHLFESDNQLRNRDYHFASRGPGSPVARGTENAQALDVVANALGTDDNVQIGIALHLFADSYSHEGFNAFHDPAVNTRQTYMHDIVTLPALGHAQEFHEPDKPYNDPAKAADAAIAIYRILSGVARLRGRSGSTDLVTLYSNLLTNFSQFRDYDEFARSERWSNFIHAAGFPVHEYSPRDVPKSLLSAASLWSGDFQLRFELAGLQQRRWVAAFLQH